VANDAEIFRLQQQHDVVNDVANDVVEIFCLQLHDVANVAESFFQRAY